MAYRPVETPQEHVRTALQLLDELESDLRVPDFGMAASYGRVVLLAAARRRLWLAVAALESPPESHRDRFVRQGVSATEVVFGAAVLVIGGAVFLVRAAWRSLWSVLRLVFTLRAIWP